MASDPARDPASEIRRLTEKLGDAECERLLRDWQIWARPEQRLPTGTWFVWLILAGRGWGKTRTGGEAVRAWSATHARIALVGRTARDTRDVMVEGESGLLRLFPRSERPTYQPSKSRVVFRNGSVASMYSADEPDQLRGPQFEKAWTDELASWPFEEAWDNLLMGLRLGENPQAVVTTTPRPTPRIREIARDPRTRITRGRTLDNKANLANQFLAEMERRYGGTRLGRQELEGEILEDTPGALWTLGMLDGARLRFTDSRPALQRVVVGVDPAITSGESSDETGIITAGVAGDGYVLADDSGRYRPRDWATKAIAAYHEHQADRIVAEANQGGEMVRLTLQTVDPSVPVTLVHATRGKFARAEPVAALYEQGRVHHVGNFPALESQMTTYVPGEAKKSPDRMDALVWALTELMLSPTAQSRRVVFEEQQDISVF